MWNIYIYIQYLRLHMWPQFGYLSTVYIHEFSGEGMKDPLQNHWKINTICFIPKRRLGSDSIFILNRATFRFQCEKNHWCIQLLLPKCPWNPWNFLCGGCKVRIVRFTLIHLIYEKKPCYFPLCWLVKNGTLILVGTKIPPDCWKKTQNHGPSRQRSHIPPHGNSENNFQKCLGMGYASSQEGISSFSACLLFSSLNFEWKRQETSLDLDIFTMKNPSHPGCAYRDVAHEQLGWPFWTSKWATRWRVWAPTNFKICYSSGEWIVVEFQLNCNCTLRITGPSYRGVWMCFSQGSGISKPPVLRSHDS